eukprot:gene24410-1565_t
MARLVALQNNSEESPGMSADHGGPLLNGDIEDYGGHPCVSCPWHGYKIGLDTGEGYYLGLTADFKTQEVKSKGRKQRVHQ